jgi:hypothetical protein
MSNPNSRICCPKCHAVRYVKKENNHLERTPLGYIHTITAKCTQCKVELIKETRLTIIAATV